MRLHGAANFFELAAADKQPGLRCRALTKNQRDRIASGGAHQLFELAGGFVVAAPGYFEMNEYRALTRLRTFKEQEPPSNQASFQEALVRPLRLLHLRPAGSAWADEQHATGLRWRWHVCTPSG